MLEAIPSFLVASRRRSREEFEERFPGTFFLVRPFASASRQDFSTIGASGGVGTSYSVARIEKRGTNAFDWMITIGRAANNDVVVPAGDVSKFHAFVSVDPAGGYTIADAGSTYGTTVGGAALQPQVPTPLAAGVEVKLGSVELEFHTGGTLYDALQGIDLGV